MNEEGLPNTQGFAAGAPKTIPDYVGPLEPVLVEGPAVKPNPTNRASLHPLITILVSAVVAAMVAALVSLAIVSLSGVPRDQFSVQAGTLTLDAGAEQEVYYKAPFRTPPHLTVGGTQGNSGIKILEQKPGHFKIANKGPFQIFNIKWNAEGIPAN